MEVWAAVLDLGWSWTSAGVGVRLGVCLAGWGAGLVEGLKLGGVGVDLGG